MTQWNGRSPPISYESGFTGERRFQLRRLTVRRRRERAGSDRRKEERRRPHSRLPVLPTRGSRALGTAAAAPVLA